MKRAISVILSLLLVVSVTPIALAAGDGDAMDWAALKEALNAGGEITLQNDVAAPEGAAALSVPKSSSVTLDLNGHTVDRGLDSAKKKGCVIEVLGELTVTDTSAEQTGAITGGYTDGTGGGVWVRADGRFTLAGGSVTGNTAAAQGGVYINDGVFDYTGGSVADNQQAAGGDIAAKSGS